MSWSKTNSPIYLTGMEGAKHNVCFKKQGKSTVILGSRDRNHADTIFVVIDTGHQRIHTYIHTCMHVCIILEKIQMSPGFWHCIMNRISCLATIRAGNPTSPGEIQMDINMLLVIIYLTIHNIPSSCQHQRSSDKFYFFNSPIVT